ncbi:hypothetical protein AAG906_017740 [Vitis piasezkii]
MEQSESTVNNCLVFAVNGKRFEVSTIHPSTTVLEFLRSHTPFKGPKLSCGEGGCGACVVLLSKYNPVHDQVDDCTVSSCLTLLCSVNGCSITTTEGLGNTKDGFHPIHERFSGFHASQCGFCTPGMCMSLFSALGYCRKSLPLYWIPPIADACKSFAADVDMEDLGFNSFWRKGDSKEVKLSSLPLYNHNDEICTFPQFLKNETRSTLLLDSSRYSWYNPVTIEELQSLLGFVEDGNGTRVKLVVGNTGMGYYKEESFSSDIATVLLAVGSTVNIMNSLKSEELTLEEFLRRPELDSKSILVGVKIPDWDRIMGISSGTEMKLLFETYRAAPRPLGNALPYLNAALMAKVSRCTTSIGIIVSNCQFAFGAYGTKHPIRATKVEEFLTGKVLSVGVLCEAVKLLRGIVVPEDGTSSPAYRSSLAVSFLFEFFSHLVESNAESPDGCVDGYSTLLSPAKQLDHGKISTLLSSAKQEVELNRQYRPVGEPIAKSGAAIQASGEAVYVDDIPSPTNCLHGAFIYGTKPLARVKGIKLNPKSVAAGVSALISFKDIPGENIGCKTMFGTEPLFADDFTRCAGEYIAFVVADTQKHANMAANLAVIDYDMENLEPPILSVEEAVRRSSFFEVPSIISPKQVGDFSRGMAEADHKILSAEIRLGSQYYFYMETQTALAVPDEDNCIVVYSSTQCPEYAHTTISRCLGIPEHNVRVITRRVGGGFGGKAMKAIAVATACALAAYKLQRPVRIYMNRKTDMKIAGGRHPMKVTYSVGFKSNGKITALHVDILINAGMGVDISPAMPMLMVGALKKYDWGAFSFDIKVCKTNHLSKSAMRAPGEVQATFISEAVIEHVASTLSMDVDSVRSGNLHTFNSLNFFFEGCAGEPVEYTLPLIWDKLATSSSFKERTDMVKQFNMCNKWQKRGISRVPIVHEISLKATPGKVSILSDGSVAVEVGGIELGQGLWTKVKQMTAFALSSIGCDGMGDFLEKVRVIQSDTLSLIQGGLTTASTTSECSCEAIRLCCNMLVKRLTPIKERLQEQMGSVEWGTLILQAQSQAVNLSASSYYVPDFSSFQYLNYGAAVSEVEVNLLTGQTTILQSDIIYDCGQSLNPAVDLGQIEGAFVQGIGFFMLEEYTTNSDGLVVTEGTWTYKIPTIDTIPKQFNVEVLNSGHHKNRVLSSKASGEPPLLLAVSVHCATRAAIREARQQLLSWTGLTKCDSTFQLEVPATMPVVKELCGLENVESYLQSLLS